MSAPFFDRLDRFVRWFFDSSPTAAIEPAPSRAEPRARKSARTRVEGAKARTRGGSGPSLRVRKAVQS